MNETFYQQICRIADERHTTPGRLLADAIKNWILYPKPAYMSNRNGIPANYPVSQSSLKSMSREVTDSTPNNPITMYNTLLPENRPGHRSYTEEQLASERYAQRAVGRKSDHYQDGITRTPTVPGALSDYEIGEMGRRTN